MSDNDSTQQVPSESVPIPTMADIEAAASDTPAERPSQVEQRTITREQYVLDMAKLVKRVQSAGGVKDGVAFNIVAWAMADFDQRAAAQAREAAFAASAEASGE